MNFRLLGVSFSASLFFFLIIIGEIVCKIVFCKQEWIGYVEHTLVYILYLA